MTFQNTAKDTNFIICFQLSLIRWRTLNFLFSALNGKEKKTDKGKYITMKPKDERRTDDSTLDLTNNDETDHIS